MTAMISLKPRWIFVMAIAIVQGCASTDLSTPTPETISTPETTPTPELLTQTVSGIATQPLSAQPITITLDDLPAPFHSNSAGKPPKVIAPPENATLNVPPGFTVNIFAENLDRPRWLALTPTGDILVTETRENRITLLRDRNHDGVADLRHVFADRTNGLNIPFGMAFAPGYFFLGNTNEVRRYPYSTDSINLTGKGTKIADLPGGGYNQHWTRNVIVSPDPMKLYVSIGSRSNVDSEPLPRASVQVMDLDGSNLQTFAYGLRNPVGLAIHPQTGELYTTVNERDGLGDDLVPDYFTRIRPGEFYGWPYTYLTPKLLDPRQTDANGNSNNPDLAAQTRTPDVLFQSHSAALGLTFYQGSSFPKFYQNGAFVAFRGSWNRNSGTGYKLVFIPFNQEGRPLGYYQDFLTGFLVDPSGPTTWGRPVGMLSLPDGSLLFTDETGDRIYRVQYAKPLQ